MKTAWLLSAGLAIAVSSPAWAQEAPASRPSDEAPTASRPSPTRTDQNAVTSAEDAFGVAVGREQLGLYASNSVRGFSPLAAGNARIDGLYFDPVYTPNDRISSSTTIRVGIAAQGYPFAAPTGIVDYQLRHPAFTASASASTSLDTWGGYSGEIDAVIPIRKDRLSLGIATIAAHEEYGDGTRDEAVNVAAVLSWKPSDSLEVTPFWTKVKLTDAQQGPIYVVEGEGLPPRLPLRQFDGPFQPEVELDQELYGTVVRFTAGPRLKFSLGAFNSSSRFIDNVTNLRVDMTPDGSFDQLLVVDPPTRTSSTSGEIRATRDFGHLGKVHVTLRTRDRTSEFGGSDVIDLGRHRIGDRVDGQSAGFTFGPLSSDHVRQWTEGIGYEGRWRGGAVSVGVLHTSYRKASLNPGFATVESRAAPWLLSATAAKRLAAGLAVYGSYVQGLEESPSAPAVAINRGEPVPAIRTRQVDGGVRLALRPGLAAVIGAFDLEKPYFDLDPSKRYRALGTVRNRGLELSLAGRLTPRLNVVAGALLQRPRVSGFAVDAGLIGDRPTNLPARLLVLNADWRLPGSERFSVDAALKAFSARPSTTSGGTSIPPRSTLALGGRYRFELSGHQAVLRAVVSNVTNTPSYVLAGAGAYALYEGRVGNLYLNVDF